jgi:hypothetical protein
MIRRCANWGRTEQTGVTIRTRVTDWMCDECVASFDWSAYAPRRGPP